MCLTELVYKLFNAPLIGISKPPFIELLNLLDECEKENSETQREKVEESNKKERKIEQSKMMNYNTNIQQQQIGRSSKYEVKHWLSLLPVISINPPWNFAFRWVVLGKKKVSREQRNFRTRIPPKRNVESSLRWIFLERNRC